MLNVDIGAGDDRGGGDARGQSNIRALLVLYRRQNGELDVLFGIPKLGDRRRIRRSHYPRVASGARTQLYGFCCPTGHGILDRDDQQAHWAAMPSAQLAI